VGINKKCLKARYNRLGIQGKAAPCWLPPFLRENGCIAAGGFALVDSVACAKPPAAIPLSFVESWV